MFVFKIMFILSSTCVCVCVSVPIGFYGLQHYLSMLGSLILVPLVIVPAMGGSHVSASFTLPSTLNQCGLHLV